MNSSGWRCIGIVLALLIWNVPAALAHTIGLSSGEYRAGPDRIDASIIFARDEAIAGFPQIDRNGDKDISQAELDESAAALKVALASALVVQAQSVDCPGETRALTLTENNGLQLDLRFQCAQASAGYLVRFALFDKLTVGHRHLAHVQGTQAQETQVLFESAPQFELAPGAASSLGSSIVALFTLGIEHILTGYDHLVFLLGLVLIGRHIRSLIWVVTAFTLGHMITFGLAALGWLTPDPGIIEPLIALTIAYIGVENFFVRDIRHRWMLAFPFGLIHGFGFGGALRELGVPQDELLSALISFNIGVEAGQLLVLLILLPLLWWLRRFAIFAKYGTAVISSLIVVAGLSWFFERVIG